MRETILLAHPTFGVLGILAALWVVVETLNASPANAARIRIAAYVCTACIVLAWIVGGYFYVVWYGTDKAAILKGA